VDPPADAHTVRPAAHCPSNAIVSVPQREGEGIAERVEEEEIRERERLWWWIRDLGRRHHRLFILRERGCAWAICRPIKHM
jgi:hypothetical protein